MKWLLLFLAISLNADSLVKNKHGYYFTSDSKTKVYFTKRQAAKVNEVLSKPNTLVIKHKYGKVKVAVNHYRVLSWEEIMDEKDKELALLFSDKKK